MTTGEPLPPGDPRDPWYSHYWGYRNRPYSGCGCIYVLMIFLIIWWLVSLAVPGVAIWGSYF